MQFTNTRELLDYMNGDNPEKINYINQAVRNRKKSSRTQLIPHTEFKEIKDKYELFL